MLDEQSLTVWDTSTRSFSPSLTFMDVNVQKKLLLTVNTLRQVENPQIHFHFNLDAFTSNVDFLHTGLRSYSVI